MTRMHRGRLPASGFTLIELLVALTLLALMSAVLFGALRLAGRSWDGGETKAAQNSEMRLATRFLRGQLGALYPQRMRKVVETPLWFAGAADDLRYTAALPERVIDGGVQFFRLHLVRDGDRSQLVLDRLWPDLDAVDLPEFTEPDRSVLADDVGSLKIGYFGRDPDATDVDPPTWRDHWDDRQRLPLMIRIDVVPAHAPAWPTIVAEPHRSPEAGCRNWDFNRQRCAHL